MGDNKNKCQPKCPPPCEPCRTINLAKPIKMDKPDMGMYEKDCSGIKVQCPQPDRPLRPTCIKVCTNENEKGKGVPRPPPPPYYAHGKLMWGVKAGILAGAIYFTYKQGVWGDQREAMECLDRWSEYAKSLNTRRPPQFDKCGNVIKTEGGVSLLQPVYIIYKEIITTCFSGVVKIPMMIKCAYTDYVTALERHWDDTKKKELEKK
ncbi:unnamed protein product [Plutella xylostella]|uniref:MICOS complex subunit MIC13 n=1 Tax=Plutella xylostella TaxID=51655 RepID=A0A8S4E073_PLUXY|nr:unnamed protein product [Plutella xylostella]